MSKYPPDWASGWGQDRYGKWLELTFDDAAQRMRWIKPGGFLMGSPEDETGRFSESDYAGQYAEGPRHKVRISQGFWLFDTPVTQDFWAAVMDSNPSAFVDPMRPVERVSWVDAMEFMARINEQIPGLDLVLPTEAQWEYACRAGTNTATYAGPMEILGEGNAPILDAIAWYRGNSGVGFELKVVCSRSDWPGAQGESYDAGTHPVALKEPNAWGLFDMLGNVSEWCADGWREYDNNAVNDPVGPLDSPWRVTRGGSWWFDARMVRAAHRHKNWDDFRHCGIGFRCARVGP
jgi:formylglycine-generating enzyme required for sulfatase activity